MTAFGKILIFLNLVFAMLTGGLIGMVYLTRTNWKVAYDKVSAAATAADASYKQLLTEDANLIRTKDQAVKKVESERDEQTKKLAAKTTEVEQLQGQLAATQRTNDKSSQTTVSVTAEIERSRAEVAQLRQQLNDRDTRINGLEQQLTRVRDESINYKLNLESLKERFQNLLTQNEELQKQVSSGTQGLAIRRPTDKGPPPENVRGTIKVVDGNLATISVGSDSGVNKDNVLQIYRLSPKAEYLGKLTILSATPFEAVGRIELAPQRPVIKVGDEVASRILGSK